MLDNVVVPMCELLPSCEKIIVQRGARPYQQAVGNSIGFNQYTMAFKEFTDSYAMGIRPLRPTTLFTFPPGFRTVTMTLREAEHWPERNSNLQEWLKAAQIITTRSNYRVVIVRDSSKADELLDTGVPDKVVVNYAVARDLKQRAGLYCSAHLNLFVNNGPGWLAFALNAPAIMFRPIGTEDSKCWAHTPQAMRQCGIVEGQQMKGAPSHQLLAWLPERAHAIANSVFDYFDQREEARQVG